MTSLSHLVKWRLIALLPLLPLALTACPPYAQDPPGMNYQVQVTWGDYCSVDRLSMDVYELLVNTVSYGENPPRASSSIHGLAEGPNLLTIRYVPKEYSAGCGGYFIALDGGAIFEDGSTFVSAKLDLSSQTEHTYNISVPLGVAIN